MNSEEKKIPNKDTDKKDVAINKKANKSDGREINHQEKQRQEQHQPRDNA